MAHTPPVARRFLTCTAAGLLSLASASTLASSFALIEQSVNGMGSAYAIGSAGINDASTVFFNPAGMSRLSQERTLTAACRSFTRRSISMGALNTANSQG